MAFDFNRIEDEALRAELEEAFAEASSKEGYYSQSEWDRKVNDLSQKLHIDKRKTEQQIREEITRELTMSEEEKEKQRQAEFEQKVRELNLRENTVLAKDILGEANLDAEDLEIALQFVVSDDADGTESRAKQYLSTLNKYETKLKEDLKNKTPNPKAPPTDTVSKDDFDKMTYAEKYKFKTENPEAYKELMGV